ncbi:phosphatase [Clostridium acetobutylicum]|nr:phosphatase [Clostridium acetobutylicum]
MIKAVIFDMDGVLIDSEPLHLDYAFKLFKELNITMTPNEYSKFIGTTSLYMWSNIKDKYNLENTVESLINKERNGFFEFLSSPNTNIKPIDYIPELLGSLKENNFKTAVASSSPMRVIKYIINNFELEKQFNELVTGDYVERSKPNPDIFLYAAKKLEVLPEQCVVIEDSHNGVLAAKNAGMKCIGFKNPNSGNQDLSKADTIIHSFNEIDILNL